MTFLDTFELSGTPDAAKVDPVTAAKKTLLVYLEKQLIAAQAYVEDGEIELTERQRWFSEDESGVVRFQIKVRNKALVLGTDKKDGDQTFIIVGEKAKLPQVITDVMQATKNSELDTIIEKRIKDAASN